MTASDVVLSKGGTTVTVITIEDEENLTKQLILLTPPTNTASQDPTIQDNSFSTLILDLLMNAEKRLTVDGYLINGTIAGDTSTTAADRKTNLKDMFLNGGVFEVTYEGSTTTYNMDKLSIKNVSQSVPNSNLPEVAIFSVKFTLVKGVNMTSN